MDIVDRRLNPKAKSLGNRQRFLRRAQGEIRDAVRDAIKKRKISEVDGGEKVRIRSKSLREPSFSLGLRRRQARFRAARQQGVLGRRRHPQAGGRRRRLAARRAAPDGEGEDDFVFTLTREEFLDLFFEDLKLPNLVKAKLKDMRVAASRCAPASPATARRRGSTSCARCATAWRGASRCIGRASTRSRGAGGRDRRARGARPARRRARSPRCRPRLARLQLPAQGRRLHRPARPAVQPLRARAEAEDPGGDVLPDGRLGVDDASR